MITKYIITHIEIAQTLFLSIMLQKNRAYPSYDPYQEADILDLRQTCFLKCVRVYLLPIHWT